MVDYYMAPHVARVDAERCGAHLGARPRQPRSRHGVLPAGAVSDVTDIQGGTTSEGIHLAAMAGSVDLMQRCFTGLETRGDRIILSPLWPEIAWRAGIADSLPRPAPAPAGQWEGRDHQRGSPRRAGGVDVECRGRVERWSREHVRFP